MKKILKKLKVLILLASATYYSSFLIHNTFAMESSNIESNTKNADDTNFVPLFTKNQFSLILADILKKTEDSKDKPSNIFNNSNNSNNSNNNMFSLGKADKPISTKPLFPQVEIDKAVQSLANTDILKKTEDSKDKPSSIFSNSNNNNMFSFGKADKPISTKPIFTPNKTTQESVNNIDAPSIFQVKTTDELLNIIRPELNKTLSALPESVFENMSEPRETIIEDLIESIIESTKKTYELKNIKNIEINQNNKDILYKYSLTTLQVADKIARYLVEGNMKLSDILPITSLSDSDNNNSDSGNNNNIIYGTVNTNGGSKQFNPLFTSKQFSMADESVKNSSFQPTSNINLNSSQKQTSSAISINDGTMDDVEKKPENELKTGASNETTVAEKISEFKKEVDKLIQLLDQKMFIIKFHGFDPYRLTNTNEIKQKFLKIREDFIKETIEANQKHTENRTSKEEANKDLEKILNKFEEKLNAKKSMSGESLIDEYKESNEHLDNLLHSVLRTITCPKSDHKPKIIKSFDLILETLNKVPKNKKQEKQHLEAALKEDLKNCKLEIEKCQPHDDLNESEECQTYDNLYENLNKIETEYKSKVELGRLTKQFLIDPKSISEEDLKKIKESDYWLKDEQKQEPEKQNNTKENNIDDKTDLDDVVKYIEQNENEPTKKKKKKKKKKNKQPETENPIETDPIAEQVKENLLQNSINRYKIHKIKFKYDPSWLNTIKKIEESNQKNS